MKRPAYRPVITLPSHQVIRDAPGRSIGRVRRLAITSVLILSACSGGGPTPLPPIPTADDTISPAAAASCTSAPTWLVRELQSSIKPKGAKVSDVFMAPASNYVMGPPIVLSSKFVTSWWVGGRISGSGVDDEVATWVTNGMSSADRGLTFAVNAAARRYSSLGADVTGDIAGDGEVGVRSCVG
jgi:hypothetical protein